jgi:hypothetical protein
MTATKFITFGLGCLLLLPFIWSFILMVRPAPEPPAEEKAFWEQERANLAAETAQTDVGNDFVMGFTEVTTYKAVTPHPGLMHVWLLASRGWVGVVGLIASMALLACLFISSFFPVIVESFGYEHHIQPQALKEPLKWFNTDDFSKSKIEKNNEPKTGD